MRAKVMDLKFNDDKKIEIFQCKSTNVCNDISKLNDAYNVAKVVCELFKLDTLVEEKLVMACADVKLKPIAFFDLGTGTSDSAPVNIKGIFQRALMCGAEFIFLVHNHPSGDITPSEADEQVTNRLVEASKILNIRFADHIIIGREDCKTKGYSIVHNQIINIM